MNDPHAEIERQKKFLSSRGVRARIYLSEEGISGQLSALKEEAQEYLEWIRERFSSLGEISFKVEEHHEHVFPRLTIKYRPHLVALGANCDLSARAPTLTAGQWKSMLADHRKEIVLLDVRNTYETAVGYFQGAHRPSCHYFRQFPEYITSLNLSREQRILLYCTGGIRCEFLSAWMREQGYTDLYQLEGGILQYGLEEGGGEPWLGKLFVFDDRLTTSLPAESAEIVGRCVVCEKKCENYYNCVNLACNELFISCRQCLEKREGCCSQSCRFAKRKRPLEHQTGKPFRRWHTYNQRDSGEVSHG